MFNIIEKIFLEELDNEFFDSIPYYIRVVEESEAILEQEQDKEFVKFCLKSNLL